MSFLDPNQDEQNQQQGTPQSPANNQPGSAPSSAGSVGGAGINPTGQSYSATAPTSGTQGTGFQNLNAYLDANQGNNLAQQVGGKISGAADQANTDFGNAQTSFKSQVDQNTVKADPNNVQSVLADPVNASKDDTAAFQKQMFANYNGPTDSNSYQPFQQAQTEAQNAYNQGQQAKDEGGRFALLNNYFQTPNYTQGQKSLDNALLVGDDQTPINNAIAQVQNLPSQYQSTAKDLNDYANTAATGTKAANEAARTALGVDAAGNLVQQTDQNGLAQTDSFGKPLYSGAFGTVENPVTQAVESYNQNAPNSFSQIKNSLSSKDFSGLTPDQLSGLGNLSQFKQDLFGVDPSGSNFLKQNAVNATPNTMISADQQARLSALYNLAKEQNTFAPDSSIAGTAPKNPYSYDQGQFQNAVQQAHTGYQSAVTPNINAIQNVLASIPNGGPYARPVPGDVDFMNQQFAAINAERSKVGLSPLANPFEKWANGQTVNQWEVQNALNAIKS